MNVGAAPERGLALRHERTIAKPGPGLKADLFRGPSAALRQSLAVAFCRWVILGGLGSSAVLAHPIAIDTPAHLKSLDAARPGDVVTLKNGNWMDARIVINKGGSPGKPVEIRAESPGGVILGGASSLVINAPYVTVDGLLFYQGALTEGSVIQFNSHHGIVHSSAVIDYNPATSSTRYYWVFFSGDSNLIDQCYFQGKNHLDPVVGNAIEASRHNSVTRSYFKDIPFAAANGREIFRIWGSGKFDERPDDGAYFNIESNLFDHADGEGTEVISLKSNRNQVVHNTIMATRGGINIRRGDFNLIKDNVILAQGVGGAYGLRMSGQHNIVQGNYVSGCDYGIRVACGEFIEGNLTNSYRPDIKGRGKGMVVATYPQVKDLTLTGNTIVGSIGPDLEMGSSYKKHWPESQQVLLPEECVIKNNRFVRAKGGASVEEMTYRINQALESLIIRRPSDWFWG